MSLEAQKVCEEIPEEGLGSLRGCLVEGNAEQRRVERRVRRRALAISIVLQSVVVAVLLLASLLGKTDTIALANVTPIPPYSPYRGGSHAAGPQQRPSGPQSVCHFCAPANISPIIVTHDNPQPGDGSSTTPFDGLGPGIPGATNDLIPISDSRQRVRPPDDGGRVARPHVVHVTTIDPAMLIHRVEPVYPPLAKQTHREGKVELRALIGTDGMIHSLQIVSGDPLLVHSALDAVQQWKYKPTILNGQAVEVDTFITVIYTMPH